MTLAAEDIVANLDKCPASPKARSEIAYRILSETNHRDELVDDIMDQYRAGFQDKDLLEDLTGRLSKERIGSEGLKDEPSLHLAWGLLPEEGNLDGYLAEYYYSWASDLNIPEEKVSNIFLEFGFGND